MVSLYSPKDSYDANFNQLLRYQPARSTAADPGVARSIFGGTDYGMRVWFKPTLPNSARPLDVINAIKNRTFKRRLERLAARLLRRTRK